MSAPSEKKPGFLAHLWANAPLACGGACLALFFWVLIARPVPPPARLLMEVAAVIGLVIGAISAASVIGGAALLEENSAAEPLRFREAGWIMGVPVGIAFGILLATLHSEPITGSYFDLYVRPLIIAIALGATVWATLTRALLRREGLSFEDYACALFMSREAYAPLARRKMAWRAAGHARKLTLPEAQQHMPDIVPALAERLHATRNDIEGKHVLDLLGALGEKSVGPVLIEALGVERASNRRAAAMALGKLGLIEAAPRLAEVAVQDKQAAVRRAAVVALGKLKTAAALPALIKATEDNDAGTRRSACVALGKLKARDALPTLHACLQDSDRDVRKSAASAVEAITGQDVQVDEGDK